MPGHKCRLNNETYKLKNNVQDNVGHTELQKRAASLQFPMSKSLFGTISISSVLQNINFAKIGRLHKSVSVDFNSDVTSQI